MNPNNVINTIPHMTTHNDDFNGFWWVLGSWNDLKINVFKGFNQHDKVVVICGMVLMTLVKPCKNPKNHVQLPYSYTWRVHQNWHVKTCQKPIKMVILACFVQNGSHMWFGVYGLCQKPSKMVIFEVRMVRMCQKCIKMVILACFYGFNESEQCH